MHKATPLPSSSHRVQLHHFSCRQVALLQSHNTSQWLTHGREVDPRRDALAQLASDRREGPLRVGARHAVQTSDLLLHGHHFAQLQHALIQSHFYAAVRPDCRQLCPRHPLALHTVCTSAHRSMHGERKAGMQEAYTPNRGCRGTKGYSLRSCLWFLA